MVCSKIQSPKGILIDNTRLSVKYGLALYISCRCGKILKKIIKINNLWKKYAELCSKM